ncbi:MAG: hypothetical protein QXQ53_04460 [Candidatus Methanosuratincola sp.]
MVIVFAIIFCTSMALTIPFLIGLNAMIDRLEKERDYWRERCIYWEKIAKGLYKSPFIIHERSEKK